MELVLIFLLVAIFLFLFFISISVYCYYAFYDRRREREKQELKWQLDATAGMDSEFRLSPERGRQTIQFFVLGFSCLRRVFMTLLQLHVHSFLIHFV